MSENERFKGGGEIRKRRREKGWTQAELGQKAGVSRQAIYNLEAGRSSPKLGTARRLAQVLEMPLDRLA